MYGVNEIALLRAEDQAASMEPVMSARVVEGVDRLCPGLSCVGPASARNSLSSSTVNLLEIERSWTGK